MKEMNNIEKYTDKEWEELASILSGEKSENMDLLNRFKAEDLYDTDEQWKELRSMGSEKEIDVDKAWDKVYSRMNEKDPKSEPQTRIISMRRTLLRIAAVGLIIVSLGAVAVYLNNSGYLSRKITVTTTADQKNLQVDLPDGSKIYLNRSSAFSYHSDFGKHKRNVTLKGEAFFEISHDASKPFVIDAGMAKVRVVGTSFNVITNNVQSEVEVFVKTGKVILSNQEGSELALQPGDIGKANAKTSEKEINSDPNYLSWNTGLLVYNGQKLEVVFRDLKKVYNMDIVTSDKSILDYTWTTSPINNQPENTIIQLICTSFNLSYTKDGNVYHLSKR